MPSYAQLQAEPVWGAQTVPPNMHTVLIAPLRAYFNRGPAVIGAPGDNNHLYGRHRSARWCRTSRYCTDRNYGTVDGRDRAGDQDWYRAFDVGIGGEALQAASRRLDTLVRAGRLPGLAEWFGTFSGRTVVGWYEGHPSSSDDSHLYHLHGGMWTRDANDANQLRLIYAAITGEDEDVLTEGQGYALHVIHHRLEAILANRPTVSIPAWGDREASIEPNQLAVLNSLSLKAVVAVEARDKVAAVALAAISELIKTGGGNIDTAAVLAQLDKMAASLGQSQATVVADLQAEIDRLTEALLAGARAQADILDHAP